MYLHAAANGSRTYGRTGLKCQNGWHALCGMAPTLWSSIRHVDQNRNICARRERCACGFCAVVRSVHAHVRTCGRESRICRWTSPKPRHQEHNQIR